MNAPEIQRFELVFTKRDELLLLDPGQSLDSAEIIATCEVVQEVNDVFPTDHEEPSFTYT